MDLARVECPNCSGLVEQTSDIELCCRRCLREYPIIDGIPVLMLDLSRDTALDLAQYEAAHPVDPDRRARIFNFYNGAMQEYGVDSGTCLEIGSGTGNLTVGLVDHSSFDEVHCSDISLRFLTRLRELVNTNNRKLKYWIFDASSIPFKAGSMDAVFGHSVLHHLLEYEVALTSIFRVLRPGGLAMFGEPIMDCHAITSFCAALIFEMEKRHPAASLTDSDLNVLRAVGQQCATIGRRMRDSRHELASMEDKHIYIIHDMLRLTRSIGFRQSEYTNAVTPEHIGQDHKFRLTQTLEHYGVPKEKLEPYDFIFEELTKTYGAAMGKAAPYNFGYFVLKK
jgi:ubiquinone/menaquinone biosynthesis C-methylase UbiE/uncharacterized protein YbaR (Trm112 family)